MSTPVCRSAWSAPARSSVLGPTPSRLSNDSKLDDEQATCDTSTLDAAAGVLTTGERGRWDLGRTSRLAVQRVGFADGDSEH